MLPQAVHNSLNEQISGVYSTTNLLEDNQIRFNVFVCGGGNFGLTHTVTDDSPKI